MEREVTGKNKIRIILIEDYALIRAGMRALLKSLPNVTLVAEAQDGPEAIDLVCEHQPDVLLLDIGLPTVNGHDVTTTLSKEFPDVQVLILSSYTGQDDVVKALQAGAAGYLPKLASENELELAIKTVANGQTYISPSISHHLAAYIRNEPVAKNELVLTPRQIETLTLIANGRSTKEIATSLNISIKTAETHRANIMERLEIYDVAGLVRYAIKTGLVND